MDNKNNDIFDRLSRLAFITAVIGVCTIGICPAFGAIGISVPLTLKRKNVQLSEYAQNLNKKALFAGVVSIGMFLIDLVLVIVLNSKFGWFK